MMNKNNNTLRFNLFFFLFLFSTFNISHSLTLSELCHPHDKRALLNIKKVFHNPPLFSSWDPKTDCCGWDLVVCHRRTNRVAELYLRDDDKVTGQIPPQLAGLPYLETLVLFNLSNINGPIHPSIAKLKNLKSLMLSTTNLSGPIPNFITQLNNLTYLNLSFNRLSGSIPSSLSQLPNLSEGLHLEGNKFTGSIPESFGSFPQKTLQLFLSQNKLTGTIPASFVNMDFAVINLSGNRLEGDAFMLFGPNKTTWSVDVSRNRLEFDLSDVKFSNSLANLDLSHNKIVGRLPEELAELPILQVFNVSYNRLCGQIPQGGMLQWLFDYSSYFHNRCLCGAPLPSCK